MYSANPDGLTLNIAVTGATGELARDELVSMSEIQLNNVRYLGSSPAEMATLQGDTNLSLLIPLASAQPIASGRLKANGIFSAKHSALLPDVPTRSEAGVSGYDFQIWHRLLSPLKTNAALIQKLNKICLLTLKSPEVKDRFNSLGFTIIGNTPITFTALIKNDIEKFRKIVIDSGITLE